MMGSNQINRLISSTYFRSGKFNRLSNMCQGEIPQRSLYNISATRNATEQKQHSNLLHCQTSSYPLLKRTVTTVVNNAERPGFLKRMMKKMGWLDHSRSKLRRSGFVLYENIGEKVSALEFIAVCDLPDTFFSWFLVTELHVWMMVTRLMAEGEEGRYARNCMIEAMWEDVEMRAKKLGDSSPTARNEQIQDIVSSFQSALFSYDEGLMSDDKVLASALWRRLFSKECDDPERLECIVQYVRKQTAYLDTVSRKEVLIDCKVGWIPLLEDDIQN
ncbi:ubiquinol-cytochrome-c reductase complex assembly factor 1 [Palaemon carinicauda]|uniref:ubiquinol-cytochrome-c reductase complex assembly factor 1 n=1 Tax=Palaemon carinicauda TaxID=392227 RepID=UPI0035B69467